MSDRDEKGRFIKGHIDLVSDDARERMAAKKRGVKRPPYSEEWKRRISIANKGRHPWNIGKVLPRGADNPKWKGGYEHKALLNNQRRVMKLNAVGSHTLKDWKKLKEKYQWTCPCCKRQEPVIKLSKDHIIPLSLGGSDYIENIQPLCGRCNSIKHTKIIPRYEMYG